MLILNACFKVGANARSFCPNGWVVYEDSCYLFADETNVSWTEAIHFCQSHSRAHLITVETKAEDMFIKDHARKLFKDELGVSSARNSFWLGASDDEIEGQWIWDTNHQLLNYTSFHTVYEIQGPSQDCLILWGCFNMDWGDYFCDAQSHAICKLGIEEYQHFLENVQVVG
ncbi:perlucin-like protein isoform X2 [Dreissena polymorpha]|uniref:perlucin-like protein isoform X2 n=1 Tax=Dreissena polymorpha TaxID=45954 RepID=UPI0022649505|nr:perlucin-like protein isoform X2 [Dreissena polymorpha]